MELILSTEQQVMLLSALELFIETTEEALEDGAGGPELRDSFRQDIALAEEVSGMVQALMGEAT